MILCKTYKIQPQNTEHVWEKSFAFSEYQQLFEHRIV